MAVRNYQGLIAWQRAMDLVTDVYSETSGFPREEMSGLTNQLRRAAVSIPANIAEGQGRGGDREFRQFLRISHGSLREVETHLIIAARLKYMAVPRTDALLDKAAEVGRLIKGLLRSKKDLG